MGLGKIEGAGLCQFSQIAQKNVDYGVVLAIAFSDIDALSVKADVVELSVEADELTSSPVTAQPAGMATGSDAMTKEQKIIRRKIGQITK